MPANEVLVDSDSEVRRTNEGEAAAIALQDMQKLFGPASKFLVHGVFGSPNAILVAPLFGFGHSHSPKVAKFEFTFLGTEKIAQQPIYCLPSRVQCKVGGVFFFSDLHISVRIMDFSSFLDVATFQSFRCLPKRGINFSISPFPDGGLQLLCRAVA
jgi:hypothetical protein